MFTGLHFENTESM